MALSADDMALSADDIMVTWQLLLAQARFLSLDLEGPQGTER
jgi:hypothetical protein